MDSQIDFLRLASALNSRARDLVPAWLPGGKLKGREYCCGDLTGKPGDSMRVNIDTGKWADFAGNVKGGDLISLYAAIHNLSQIEAAKSLVEAEGLQHTTTEVQRREEKPEPLESPTKPPKDAPKPNFSHSKFGLPVAVWPYKDFYGDILFHVARYETEEGKQLFPLSWFKGGWQFKGWLPPRPLYGLDELAQKKSKPVLIVEGEKSAEAAKKIAGEHYAVVTWPNGSKAVSKADWTPLHGKNILIWPDADESGIAAGYEISTILKSHCQSIKLINPEGKSKGWDAADALSLGWTWNEFKDWAKSRVEVRNLIVAPDTTPTGQTNIQVNIHNIFAEDVESVSGTLTAVYERIGVATGDKGTPICNSDAALRVIEGIPEFKDLVWFDEFHNKFYTSWQTDKPQEWTSYHDGELTLFMQRFLGMRKIGIDHTKMAVKSFAMKRIKNEPRDWMGGLKWDGTLRINDFLTEVYGVPKTGYSVAVSKNFWIGLAARVFHPGCKLDNMIVLEGGQGIGKTTSLEIIGGPWFTDIKESLSSKDFFISLQGKLVIEIAELDNFNKADVTRIKQVVTSRVDRYRDPYDDRAKDHPRMCVFVGSTNENQWQRDHTGGRRFWPISCQHFNLDILKKNREQYFAEAVQRLKDGEDWYETPYAETVLEQERRRQADEWEGIIADYLAGGMQGVLLKETTIRDIALNCLRIDAGKLDVLTQRRIGKVLKTLGWDKKRETINGNRSYYWAPEERGNDEEGSRILKTENIY